MAFAMSICLTCVPANARDYLTQDAFVYIQEKSAAHDLVFMGTTHKQPAILDFIADLLPKLHTMGVTHLALEVASDQQALIDHYLDRGLGLADIHLHRAIDCPRYRHLFTILKGLTAAQRPKVVAVDLPPRLYDGPIDRDAHMAEQLEKTLQSGSKVKVLAILGSFHVMRQLQWQARVPNGHHTIRTLLKKRHPRLSMFSIAHILSQSGASCDFSRRLAPVDHSVAMDIDQSFDGWRLGLIDVLAIKPAPARQLLDGVIVH